MFSFQRYFSDDSKVPVLIVGNKADMTAVRQDYILQPEAFCAKHRVNKNFGYSTMTAFGNFCPKSIWEKSQF